MAKGDVVLLSFPFTDLSESKLRPAVVLVESALDVTVCFVTTQLFWKDENDLKLSANQHSGIKKESLLRVSKIATLVKAFLKGTIGSLNPEEISGLNRKLKWFLIWTNSGINHFVINSSNQSFRSIALRSNLR